MSNEKLVQVYSLIATIEAFKAEVEAMRIDNVVRDMKGLAPAWDGDSFIILSDELHNTAIKLHNISEGKEEERDEN